MGRGSRSTRREVREDLLGRKEAFLKEDIHPGPLTRGVFKKKDSEQLQSYRGLLWVKREFRA